MRLTGFLISISNSNMNKRSFVRFSVFSSTGGIFPRGLRPSYKKAIYPSFPIANREQLLYYLRTVSEWQLGPSRN